MLTSPNHSQYYFFSFSEGENTFDSLHFLNNKLIIVPTEKNKRNYCNVKKDKTEFFLK